MTTRDSNRRRMEQARTEVGRTVVAAWVARLASALFLVTVVSVPLIDGLAGERPGAWLRELGSGAAAAAREAEAGRLVSANRALLEAIASGERRLEEDTLLHDRLLPPVQGVLTGILGAGNERVYPGRDGWLFYAEDVDYLAGPGFLEPRALRRRERAGEAWRRPARPDPVAALAAFARDLERRGIALLVMPTPLKPAIHPEYLTSRPVGRPLRNQSVTELLAQLQSRGIAIFDCAPLLASAADQTGEPQFLRTDTHWTPAAVERVAAELARRVEGLAMLEGPRPEYRRRPVTVEGEGDIAAMLRLPPNARSHPPQRVATQRVLTAAGGSWRPDRNAEVLLLGDSFTNVFSDAGLGWGAGAGLAEQLAFDLRRPVDRLAVNAGGAAATRQALARDPSRLEGKKVVIYQFANRDLAQGDWLPTPLE